MRYLFFDIECCDGRHLCSFGYVITNEKFRVLKKEDIIINPCCEFKVARSGFDPNTQLAYPQKTFKKQKPFYCFYSEIKNLMTAKNQVVFGHGVLADLLYLKIACKRYFLPGINIIAYDTQDFYYQLNKQYKSRGLDNIVKDLGIDISNLQEHKSCDDAHITMLITKEICARLNISIHELLKLCDSSKTKIAKKALANKRKKAKN